MTDLTDGQREELEEAFTEAIAEYLDPISIAENHHERCDYGCRLHTVVTPVAAELARKLAPLVGQWLAPEGWTVREEWRWGRVGSGSTLYTDAKTADELKAEGYAVKRRTVHESPWEEA